MKLGTVVRKELNQLIFIILSFSLMVVLSYFFTKKMVENLIFNNAKETLNTAEVSIHSDLREAETALLHVEILIQNWIKLGDTNEEIRAKITALAETMTIETFSIQGIMNIYGVINGELMTGLYGDPSPGFIPEQRPWYQIAEAGRGKVVISPPYIDWRKGIYVISLSKTIYNSNGLKYGTIALDLDFSMISSYVESISFAKNGYGILCDQDFLLLVHPFYAGEDFTNRPLIEINPSYKKLVEGFKENNSGIITMRMKNINNVDVLLIARGIYNNWYLILATPVISYYRDVYTMAITLSALGIISVSVLCFILIRLSILKTRSEEENLGKTSFLARMSHEIRTPMNSILGMAELIQRKDISGEIREYIEIINQSGNSLLSIINDILDFSKIESGQLQIQNRNYQISSVVNDMINMMRSRIAEKSLDFLVNLESDIPAKLFGDDLRLRQILTNLLSNAVKYTHKGYISLDISMERIDNTRLNLICAVHDTGIGIKEEDRERLFSEFARIDDILNQGIEGTGLGLSITRALCLAMGGDISVTSEYGKGSVFWATITQEFENYEPVALVQNPEKKRVLFYDWRQEYIKSISHCCKSLGVKYKCSSELQEFIKDLEYGPFDFAFISSKYALDCIDIPAMRDEPLQLAIMVEPGEMSEFKEVSNILMPVYSIPIANVLNNTPGDVLHQAKKPTIQFSAPSADILIVDDISTNLRVAKELMAPYNMNVQTCMSGAEALSLVKANHFDIVFMDHMMPGMDGIEATSYIRNVDSESDYYKNLPIIALSANAVFGQREIFLQNGLNDFLAKPIEIQKLDEILEKWLPPEKRCEADTLYLGGPIQEKTEVINIQGIDINTGLRNCGGEVRFYYEILEDFCNDVEGRMAKINDALAQADIKLYTTLVHALKGAARSIGAMEIGEKASWLEKTAPNGQINTLRGKTNDLQESLRILINSIRSATQRYEKDTTLENAEINTLRLETLKSALEELDIEAVNRILMAFAGLSLDKERKDKLSEIEQLILLFEYDKAIEKINDFFGPTP